MRTKPFRPALAPLALHLALCLLAAARTGAADATLTLGRTERWSDIASMDRVRTAPGRWGELDLVLAEAAYESSPDTDLLLHFDELPYRDAAGGYDVSSSRAELSGREKVMGAGAGAFVGPQTALRLDPRRGSLFSPGVMWQDFSIELWLYPASLSNGESVLAWSGHLVAGSAVTEQAMSLSVRQRRLVFRFEHFFGGSGGSVVELRGITALVPRQWHHHLLRFDSRRGMLEYLVDGVPQAVAYATDTGREGGSIALPVIGALAPLELGDGASVMVDELRISRRFVDDPTLTRLDGRTGTAVSRIFDLGLAGTSLSSISAVYETPRNSGLYFYYRMADRIKARGELETAWMQFAPGTTGLPGRGRYLQLMVELLPDGALELSPSVSSITVSYEPDLPPAPPARLLALAGDTTVSLSWSRVNETDVAGYRVYYGSRPGVYQNVLDVGAASSRVIEGLENGKLYYFTVVSYDSADPRRRSAFAPEVGARPSGLKSRGPTP